MSFQFQGVRYHWSLSKFLLNLFIFATIFFVSFSYIRSIAGANPDKQVVSLTVHRGDTLWSIARAASPNDDPRQTIAAIKTRNHLKNSESVTGQQLVMEIPSK